MDRRKFIVGMGSLAAGGAAAIGTGAFTSVEAERDAEIDIEDDANAYLGLVAGNANGWAVQTVGGTSPDGTLMIEMNGQSDVDGGGTGVNANALNRFDDVFRIVNQADSKKKVWITYTQSGGSNNIDNVDINFYTSNGSLVGASNAEPVGTGNELAVGINVDTTDVDSAVDPGHVLEDITIHAEDV